MTFKRIQLVAQIVGLVTILVLCVLGVLALASGDKPASAALGPTSLSGVANVINYQGMLRQPDGTPLNGTYSMTFRLYDEPEQGTLLHTETLTEVVVRDGLFTVLLGDTAAINAAAFQNRLYASIQVGSDAEMEPRQRIAPVPYAVQLTDGVYVGESGDVGIGTTELTQTLTVDGRIYVEDGVIQRGGDPITETNELGLYSQVDGDWMRFVTNNGRIAFYTDGDEQRIGEYPSLEIRDDGSVGMNRTYQTFYANMNTGVRDLGQWDFCAISAYEVAGVDDGGSDWARCSMVSYQFPIPPQYVVDPWEDSGPHPLRAGDRGRYWYLIVWRGSDNVDWVKCEATCFKFDLP